MKLGFLLYLLLMLMDGLVTWQAGDSAMLLSLPTAGVLIYGAICGRQGIFPEVFRFFIAVLIVVLGAMQYGQRPYLIFITFLALPHFLAATQCLAELRDEAGTRPKAGGESLTVFSLAFYASCTLAFVLLKADDLRLAWLHQQLLAGGTILLALLGWECSRIPALRLGATSQRLSLSGKLRRWGLVIGLGTALLLIMLAALPPVARYACEFSPALKNRAQIQGDFGPPHRPQGRDVQSQTGTASANALVSIGIEETARSGRVRLPQRVQLQKSDAPRVYLKFDDPSAAQAESFVHPFYVRCLGLSHYEESQWFPTSETGVWNLDAEDGQNDGRVTLESPSRFSLAYTLFVPEHDGYALPVLSGLQQIEIPKLYRLPEDWFQIKETGSLKFHAHSEPRFWNQRNLADCRAGEAGAEYLRVPEDRLGGTLRQLSEQIFAHRKTPADALPALANFFAQHYTYATKIENPHNLPPLENFLLDERKGYCDLFATSAALLLRKAGIPTRMAFGYMGGSYDEKSKLWTFQQRHAHAWVELFLQDDGWVMADFTPKDPEANSGAPQTEPNWSEFADAAIPAPEPPPTPKLEPPSFFGQIHEMWASAASDWALKLFGLIAGLAVMLLILRQFKPARSPEEISRKAQAKRDQEPAYLREFWTLCEENGQKRSPGATLREMEERLKATPLDHPNVPRMTHYHYGTRYEDAPVDQGFERELVQSWRSLRKAQASH